MITLRDAFSRKRTLHGPFADLKLSGDLAVAEALYGAIQYRWFESPLSAAYQNVVRRGLPGLAHIVIHSPYQHLSVVRHGHERIDP